MSNASLRKNSIFFENYDVKIFLTIHPASIVAILDAVKTKPLYIYGLMYSKA